MSEQKNLKSLKAVVTTVITTAKDGSPLVKTRQDGTTAPYALCGLKLTEGAHAGKTLWAQRTLINREGVAKEPVAKGDEVFATLVNVVVDKTTGKPKPMFEVTTSSNASDDELLSAFGEEVATTTTATVGAEEEIPLQA